jgi:hypothetical protein
LALAVQVVWLEPQVLLAVLHILAFLLLITFIFLLLAGGAVRQVHYALTHQAVVVAVVLAGLVLMALLLLLLVGFQAVIFTTAERLVQMLWAVVVEVDKALLLYQALLAVLNGAVVLAVEAEPMDQLAIVVAAGQFLAAVVAVAVVILRLVFLDEALAEALQLT